MWQIVDFSSETWTYLGAVRGCDLDFVLLTRAKDRGAIWLRRNCQRENSKLVLGRMVLLAVPLIEVSILRKCQQVSKSSLQLEIVLLMICELTRESA